MGPQSAPQPPSPPPPTAYAAYPAYPAYPAGGWLPGMRQSRFTRYLVRWWWVPVLTTALAVCAAAFYVLRQPPRYVSRGALVVAGRLNVPGGNIYSEDLQNALGTFFGTQVKLLESATLQQRASNRVAVVKPELPWSPVTVKIKQTPKTALITLEATGLEPQFTQAFLEALVEEYFTYRKGVRAASSDDTLASVTKELAEQEKVLKAAQDKLLAAQKESSLTMVQDQNNNVSAYLSRLLVQRDELKRRIQKLELVASGQEPESGDTNQTEGASVDPRELADTALPISARTTEYLNTKQRIEMLKVEREELSRYLRPKHPKILKLDEEIARGDELVGVFRNESREQLASSQQALQMELNAIEDSVREWRQMGLETSERIANLEELKLNVQRAQGLYDRLLTVMQNIGLGRNVDQESVTVMEKVSAAEPKPAGLPGMLARAAMVGLVLGLGLIYFVETIDDRIMSLTEVTERFEQEVLGQVPEVRRDRRTKQVHILDPHDHRHAFAESLRSIRSSLLFVSPGTAPPKLLLVTSAVPGEGKSTVAINLARAIAFGDARVLLVDGDLRRGALHEQLGLTNEVGFTELLNHEPVADHDRDSEVQLSIRTLSEQALRSKQGLSPAETQVLAETVERLDDLMAQRIKHVMQKTHLPHLYLVSCGKFADDAGELFLSPSTDAFLKQVRDRFDFVVIDSPPVLAVDDTTNLAAKVDGVLFVVRGRFTRARVAAKALDLLEHRSAKVLGIVFNRARVGARDNYYYKYTSYYGGRRREKPPHQANTAEPTA